MMKWDYYVGRRGSTRVDNELMLEMFKIIESI